MSSISSNRQFSCTTCGRSLCSSRRNVRTQLPEDVLSHSTIRPTVSKMNGHGSSLFNAAVRPRTRRTGTENTRNPGFSISRPLGLMNSLQEFDRGSACLIAVLWPLLNAILTAYRRIEIIFCGLMRLEMTFSSKQPTFSWCWGQINVDRGFCFLEVLESENMISLLWE